MLSQPMGSRAGVSASRYTSHSPFPIKPFSGRSLKRVLFNASYTHEASLAFLLLCCGIFLILAPAVLAGPVGMMARDDFPQWLQGCFLLFLGASRMYGVLADRKRIRLWAGAGSAVVWLSFFLMSIGSVPPSMGNIIYLWLSLNSMLIVFRIGSD